MHIWYGSIFHHLVYFIFLVSNVLNQAANDNNNKKRGGEFHLLSSYAHIIISHTLFAFFIPFFLTVMKIHTQKTHLENINTNTHVHEHTTRALLINK